MSRNAALMIRAVEDAQDPGSIAAGSLTVGELIEHLEDLPRDMAVLLDLGGSYGRLAYTRLDDGEISDNGEFTAYCFM